MKLFLPILNLSMCTIVKKIELPLLVDLGGSRAEDACRGGLLIFGACRYSFLDHISGILAV